MKLYSRRAFLFLFAGSGSACATVGGVLPAVGVSQRAWLHGTTVVVWNATTDGMPINVFVDQALVYRALPPGERWAGNFGGGVTLFYAANYRNSLVITASAGGAAIEGTRVDISADVYGNSHRTVAIYVRGDRQHGYRMDPPRWSSY